jgi:hypothetical protein
LNVSRCCNKTYTIHQTHQSSILNYLCKTSKQDMGMFVVFFFLSFFFHFGTVVVAVAACSHPVSSTYRRNTLCPEHACNICSVEGSSPEVEDGSEWIPISLIASRTSS